MKEGLLISSPSGKRIKLLGCIVPNPLPLGEGDTKCRVRVSSLALVPLFGQRPHDKRHRSRLQRKLNVSVVARSPLAGARASVRAIRYNRMQ